MIMLMWLNTRNEVICILLCTKRTEHFRICSELHTNQLRRNGIRPIWSLMIRPTSQQMSSYNPAGYKIHRANMVYIHNKCNEYRESYSYATLSPGNDVYTVKLKSQIHLTEMEHLPNSI